MCIRDRGGTHEDGFRLALTRIVNAYARENGMIKKDETLAGDDVREGCLLYTSDNGTSSGFICLTNTTST